jgi:hypothetical protein
MQISNEPPVVARKEDKRPDGTKDERYDGLEKWSYRRWAWEFLRRNEAFIKACKKVRKGTPEQKEAVARQFGLSRFKYYRRGYRKFNKKPKFISDQLWHKANVSPNKVLRDVPMNLPCGRIVIQFDLNPALMDIKHIDRQRELAATILERALKEYAAAMEQAQPKKLMHKVPPFGVYLKILDALASGKSTVECAELFYPNSASELDRVEQRNLIKNQMYAAREYANTKYLSLALLSGSPNKKIKLSPNNK